MSKKKAGNTMKEATVATSAEALPSNIEAQVREWVSKAPEISGLRRPGTRMKAVALLQKIEAKDVIKEAGESGSLKADDIADLAEFLADLDELMGALGGHEYIDFIEQVPLDDGLQIAVLIELFSSKIAPTLGKD